MANGMHLLQVEGIEELQKVVGMVAKTTGGINQKIFGIAKTPQIGCDAVKIAGQQFHLFFPKNGRRGVAMYKKNGWVSRIAQAAVGLAEAGGGDLIHVGRFGIGIWDLGFRIYDL
jgi:hypothetical protein